MKFLVEWKGKEKKSIKKMIYKKIHTVKHARLNSI